MMCLRLHGVDMSLLVIRFSRIVESPLIVAVLRFAKVFRSLEDFFWWCSLLKRTFDDDDVVMFNDELPPIPVGSDFALCFTSAKRVQIIRLKYSLNLTASKLRSKRTRTLVFLSEARNLNTTVDECNIEGLSMTSLLYCARDSMPITLSVSLSYKKSLNDESVSIRSCHRIKPVPFSASVNLS